MKCPRCSSERSTRYRSPETRDEVILRRHRCSNCGLVYLSVQVVASADIEEQLLDLFEP